MQKKRKKYYIDLTLPKDHRHENFAIDLVFNILSFIDSVYFRINYDLLWVTNQIRAQNRLMEGRNNRFDRW